MESSLRLVIFLSLCSVIFAKSVLVYNNITSQLYTSSLLTWENFNNDPNQLKHSVEGGTFDGEEVSLSMVQWNSRKSHNPLLLQTAKAYICRATINSIPVSGYVKKRVSANGEAYGCIISQHSQMRTKPQFEVLMNKGDGAKLQWVPWEKMIPFSRINGAVSTGNGGVS